MYDRQNQPYVAVIETGKDPDLRMGIVHSLEECRLPFRCTHSDQTYEIDTISVFECFEAPMGMVIWIENDAINVYYSEYDRKRPVLHYAISAGLTAKSRYRLARGIGRKAANIIYGKEIKEIQ